MEATVTLIATYRAFRKTAARTAAATVPPASSTETDANCAAPAKVVADMTTAAAAPKPVASASTPYDRPKRIGLGGERQRRAIPSRMRGGCWRFGHRGNVVT